MVQNQYTFPFPTAIETVIAPNSEFDLTGIVSNIADSTAGNLITFGQTSDQPYIFSFAGSIFTEGYVVTEVGIIWDEGN